MALHGQTLDDADCTRARVRAQQEVAGRAGAGGALSASACACVKYVRGARHKEWLVLCPIIKNEWNKWKNHFNEMKGDVGINVTS